MLSWFERLKIFYAGTGISNNIILSGNKNFKVVSFEDQYGRTFKPLYAWLNSKIRIQKGILPEEIHRDKYTLRKIG